MTEPKSSDAEAEEQRDAAESRQRIADALGALRALNAYEHAIVMEGWRAETAQVAERADRAERVRARLNARVAIGRILGDLAFKTPAPLLHELAEDDLEELRQSTLGTEFAPFVEQELLSRRVTGRAKVSPQQDQANRTLSGLRLLDNPYAAAVILRRIEEAARALGEAIPLGQYRAAEISIWSILLGSEALSVDARRTAERLADVARGDIDFSQCAAAKCREIALWIEPALKSGLDDETKADAIANWATERFQRAVCAADLLKSVARRSVDRVGGELAIAVGILNTTPELAKEFFKNARRKAR